MTRRRGRSVDVVADRIRIARWRYAIRNPAFIAELRAVSRLLRKNTRRGTQRYQALLNKWGFDFIGLEILGVLPHMTEHDEAIRFLDAFAPVVLAHPVVAGSNQDGPWLTVTVDTSYPIDIILGAFEQELRDVVAKRKGRLRVDKVDFYVRVYDLAAAGEPFSRIAHTVRKPLSSVKSAFFVARANVFQASPGRSKRALPLATTGGPGRRAPP